MGGRENDTGRTRAKFKIYQSRVYSDRIHLETDMWSNMSELHCVGSRHEAKIETVGPDEREQSRVRQKGDDNGTTNPIFGLLSSSRLLMMLVMRLPMASSPALEPSSLRRSP